LANTMGLGCLINSIGAAIEIDRKSKYKWLLTVPFCGLCTAALI
jgi:hypothetical protein